MKVTLNKQVITLAELEQAKELQTEYKEYSRDVYATLIGNAIEANTRRISKDSKLIAHLSKVLEIESVEITKDKYILTAWISALCRIDIDTIVYISFNGTQAMTYANDDGEISAYIEVYRADK